MAAVSLQDQPAAGGLPVQVSQHELHQVPWQRQCTVRGSPPSSSSIVFWWLNILLRSSQPVGLVSEQNIILLVPDLILFFVIITDANY